MKAKGGRESGREEGRDQEGEMERLTAQERAEWGEEVGRGGVPAGRHRPNASLLPASWSLAPGGALKRWPDSC